MRNTKDKLGRAKFTPYTQNPIRNYVPDEAGILVMRFLRRHGLASSETIHQLVKHIIGLRNRHNFNEWIKELFDGEMVWKPPQQQWTKYPDGQYHVYALRTKGIRFLEKENQLEDVMRHSGWFPHQLMGATITGMRDIMCRRNGFRFIPMYETLQNAKSKKVHVPFSYNGEWISDTRYTAFDPDYVSQIDYGDDRCITFIDEYNRNSEPNEPTNDYRRRSDLKSLMQVKEFVGKKQYREKYGYDTLTIYNYVTVSETHRENFEELARSELGRVRYIMSGIAETFANPWRVPKMPVYLFDEPQPRPCGIPFTVGDPPTKKEPLPV